jgi:predicted phage-related endonuclease
MNTANIRIREKTTRQQWLAWRKHNINASEVAAIMGLDKYATPLSIYHEKKGDIDGPNDTNLMRRGRWLESAIMTAVEEERPSWKVEAQRDYYDHPQMRIGCTPDAFVTSPAWEGRGVLQAKVVAKPVFAKDWLDGDDIVIPLRYQLQTLVEAKLCGATWACVAALVVDAYSADLHIIETPIHEGAWQAILKTVAHFWQRFDAGNEPPLSPEYDGDLVKRLYATEDGSVVDLSGDNELPGLLDEYCRLSETLSAMNQQIRPVEKDREAVCTQIKAKLGKAEKAFLPGWEVTWKTQTRKASEFRVLRVKSTEQQD